MANTLKTVQMNSSGGTEINTLQDSGPHVMADCHPVTIASDQTPVPVGTPIAPVVSSAPETGHVIKNSACALYDLTVTTLGLASVASGWILIFDATTVPVDGAVTPIRWYPIDSNGINGYFDRSWPNPIKCSSGCVVVFSTNASPLIKTTSAVALISGMAA